MARRGLLSGRALAGRRGPRPSSRSGFRAGGQWNPRVEGAASDVVHRSACQRRGRRLAGNLRPGVSAMVRILPRRSRAARRLARHRVPGACPGTFRASRAHAGQPAPVSHRLLPGREAMALRSRECLLSSPSVAARRYPLVYDDAPWGQRASLVYRGHSGVVGHAPLEWRATYAQLFSARYSGCAAAGPCPDRASRV